MEEYGIDEHKILPEETAHLPVWRCPAIPKSGQDIVRMFGERVFRNLGSSNSKNPAVQMLFLAQKSADALVQFKKDIVDLGVDQQQSPNKRRSGNTVKVMDAFMFSDMSFMVHPMDVLASQRSHNDGTGALAVRGDAHRQVLLNEGFIPLQVNFVHPSHPDVTNLRTRFQKESTSTIDTIEQLYLLAQDPSNTESNRLAMLTLLARLPQFLQPAKKVGAKEVLPDSETPTLTVKASMSVSSIKTVADLCHFVEAKGTGLIYWGGADHVALRQAAWGDSFASENRKISQVLGSYCFIKFDSWEGGRELGSKQGLSEKASATLTQKPPDHVYEGLFNKALSVKYEAEFSRRGWYGVAQALNS